MLDILIPIGTFIAGYIFCALTNTRIERKIEAIIKAAGETE